MLIKIDGLIDVDDDDDVNINNKNYYYYWQWVASISKFQVVRGKDSNRSP